MSLFIEGQTAKCKHSRLMYIDDHEQELDDCCGYKHIGVPCYGDPACSYYVPEYIDSLRHMIVGFEYISSSEQTAR